MTLPKNTFLNEPTDLYADEGLRALVKEHDFYKSVLGIVNIYSDSARLTCALENSTRVAKEIVDRIDELIMQNNEENE